MTEISIVQTMMNRLGTEQTASSSQASNHVRNDGFSGILNDKMAERAVERRSTTPASETRKNATERKTETARRDVEKTGQREMKQSEAFETENRTEKNATTQADRSAEKAGTVKNSGRENAQEATSAGQDKFVSSSTEKSEATAVASETEEASDETAAGLTAEEVSALSVLVDKILLMLEERLAELKQELADGAGTNLVLATPEATEATLANDLAALLGQLKEIGKALLQEGTVSMDDQAAAFQKLLEKIFGEDANLISDLTVKSNQIPEHAEGNALLQLKIQLEGLQAKLKVMSKVETTAAETAGEGSMAAPEQTGVVAETGVAAEAGQGDGNASAQENGANTAQLQGMNAGKVETVFADTEAGVTEKMSISMTARTESAAAARTEAVEKSSATLRPTVLTDVQKEAVTGQVVAKVKLLSGESKTEMEMTLKPESLGKVNLKLVEERGQILARFTAESEQVKSILESNMQLLKDALEKSGVQISDLSVSVGQQGKQQEKAEDSDRNNGQQRTASTGRVSISEKLRGLPTLGSYQLSQRTLEYLTGGESSINVTA